jgi:chromosome partitioning protein
MSDIRAEAAKNQWKIFNRQIPFSRGFPKMMHGNYRYLGSAYEFYDFAAECLKELGL